MEDIIRFLEQLRRHNNREWFEANKLWYRDVKARFDGLVARLIDAIAAFDPSVAGLAVKDCTYRIYRDTRFSPNKEPYKTHFGAYFCPRGKKSGYAGYYFHVEPQGDGLIGGHLLSAGLYMPEPNVLKSVRDEIFDNGERFAAAVRGEPDAVNTVIRHYSGYIAALSTRTSYDVHGCPYSYVDEELRRRLETKLIIAILDFDLN